MNRMSTATPESRRVVLLAERRPAPDRDGTTVRRFRVARLRVQAPPARRAGEAPAHLRSMYD